MGLLARWQGSQETSKSCPSPPSLLCPLQLQGPMGFLGPDLVPKPVAVLILKVIAGKEMFNMKE